MSKKIIFHIALLGIFSNADAMNLYGSAMEYSMRTNAGTTITAGFGSQVSPQPSTNELPEATILYDAEAGKTIMHMGEDRAVVEEDFLRAMTCMATAAKKIRIATTPDGKNFMQWQIESSKIFDCGASKLIGVTKNNNNDDKYISRIYFSLKGQYFRSSLNFPFPLNPFGSIVLRSDHNRSLILGQEAVEIISDLLKGSEDGIALKIGPKNPGPIKTVGDFFPQITTYKVFLPKDNVLKINNFLYRKQQLRYLLLGGLFSMMLIFAAMRCKSVSK